MRTIDEPSERLTKRNGTSVLRFAFLFVAAIGLNGCVRMGKRSSVDTVCQMEDGAFVTVEGFLQLPNFLEARIDPDSEAMIYSLLLAAEQDGKKAVVKTSIPGTRAKRTNHIAELPVGGYTRSDLQVFTASGETVGSGDRLRVSGEVSKREAGADGPCILKTETIELP